MTAKLNNGVKCFILIILCVIVLMLVFIVPQKKKNVSEQIEVTETKKCDYKKMYREYINTHSLYEGLKPGEYGNEQIKLIYKYDDIDGDGIPEFLYEHKNIVAVADFAHILTIKNGKVISVEKRNKKSGDMPEAIGELGYIKYYPGKNLIRDESVHAGVIYIFYYSIDADGNLNEEASLVELFHGEYVVYESEYMVAMKTCSKREFGKYESRIEKYKCDYMSSAESHGEKDLTEEAFN